MSNLLRPLPRLWLLDFDGPISDVVVSYILTYAMIIKELLGLEDYTRVLIGKGIQFYSFREYCTIIHARVKSLGLTPKCTVDEMVACWGKWPEIDKQVPYVTGVIKSLRALRSALKPIGGVIAIVSNRGAKSFEMHRTRLEGLVDHILIDDEGRNFPPKSNPAMLLEASRLTGISLAEAVMVGDSPNDSLAVQNAIAQTGIEFPYYDVQNGYPGRPRDYPYIPVANLPTLINRSLEENT